VSAIERLLQRPLKVLHQEPGGTDGYGNEVPGPWVATGTLGCLEQQATTEVVVGQDSFQADWLCVLPAGTALGSWDRIECPDLGATFEVVGLPNRLRRARTDTESHVEASCRQVTQTT
jgi:hypothetical protein